MAKKIPRKKKSSSKKEKAKVPDMKKRQYATIALGGGVALLVLFVLGMLYANSVEVSENSPAPVKFFKGNPGFFVEFKCTGPTFRRTQHIGIGETSNKNNHIQIFQRFAAGN